MKVASASSACLLSLFVGGFTLLACTSENQAELQIDSYAPIEELRALAEEGNAGAQWSLGIKLGCNDDDPVHDAEAARWFQMVAKEAAQQGDPTFAYELGKMYKTDDCVKEDLGEVRIWYELAVRLGHIEAMKELGEMYELGQFQKGNKAELAELYYRQAANLGDAGAQHDLGILFLRKIPGGKTEKTQALKWLRKAADQDEYRAQYEVGVLFREGYLVPQDYVRAYMWFSLSASRPEASRVGRESEARNGVMAKMTPDQIAEGQRLGREWVAAHPSEAMSPLSTPIYNQ